MAGLLVCSHRGPFSYEHVDGRLQQRQGSGGVVTALSALLRNGTDVSWLACALSDLDREVAAGRHATGGGDLRAHLLEIPRDVHRSFYDDACITGLGFLFHGLVDQAYTPTFDARFGRGWASYQEVNRAYAAQAAKLAGDRPILVEDYHLMLVADALRELGHRRAGPTAYFHHIPWCPPAYLALLPRQLRVEILAKILAFDTIGFHARRWADEFLACCDAFLPYAHCEPDAVKWRDREIPIVVAPVQIDGPHLQEIVHGDAAAQWRRRLARRTGGRRVVARVDRVDLWKNILRGFLAFEHMLGDNAADQGADDVVFLALLAKSRMHVPEYRQYLAACLAEARRINRRLRPGRPGPIHVLLADDHSDHGRALAGLSLADVVLVNSTSDGLNLVAKESVVASAGRSRLVLSETTGVYEEIGRWTYGINPFDVEETAGALARALRDAGGTGQPASALAEIGGVSQPGRELLAAVSGDSPAAWVRRRLAPLAVW